MVVNDTHVWLWWMNHHPRLRPVVRDLLDAEKDVRVSATSLMEVALAVAAGRLDL